MPDSGITKRVLAQALKELMQTQSLHKISVGDICEQCSMNRKSFYYHFKDKYDLVNWIYYTEFFDSFLQDNPTGGEAIERICKFFADNRQFYKNALQLRGQNSFYEYFGEVLTPVIRANLAGAFAGDEDQDFYLLLYSEVMRDVIVRWLLDDKQIPPERFVKLLHNAIVGLVHQTAWPD